MNPSFLISRAARPSLVFKRSLRDLISRSESCGIFQAFADIHGRDKKGKRHPTVESTCSKIPRSTQFSGMKIATLQFAPRLGDVEGNIKRADRLLKLSKDVDIIDGENEDDGRPGIEELNPDILVLPEMAFSGYNFPSLDAIRPYLEQKGEGPSAQWARKTAQRLKCKVCVGYAEVYRGLEISGDKEVNDDQKTGGNQSNSSSTKFYNSLLVVDEEGKVIHNYRKRFLYYTDESWASEGEAEWSFKSLQFFGNSPASLSLETERKSIHVPTTFGICMDINPYKFEAPFDAWEFAHRVLDSRSHLVIISAAWLVADAASIMGRPGQLPDMDTFNYWLRRFWPLLEKKIDYGDGRLDGFSSSTETRVIIVFANRTGVEEGDPGCLIPTATYAGTSTVVAITHRKDSTALDVKIHCWDLKGAKEEGICFANTSAEPKMTFVTRKPDDPSE